MRPIVYCRLINGPFGDPVLYADIMFERRSMLFDIGDISSLAPRQLLRVSHVFVSHAHMDHFAGFDRLLRLLLGRDRTVALYGPAGFIDKVEHKLHAYSWNLIRSYAGNLVFDVCEVHEDGTLCHALFQSRTAFECDSMRQSRLEGDVLASCGAISIRCAVLDHGTPCLAFAIVELAHVNIWKTRLEELGLVVGPWLRDLKRAILESAPPSVLIHAVRQGPQGTAPVMLPFGTLRDIAQVTPGQKVAYVVDARYHPANAARIERLASGADILFIECAFLEVDAGHAARKNHLTARQAGTLARRAHVKRLEPCHFSTRYTDCGALLLEEAQLAFQGPTDSEDND
jgi:ribonuclease Z